jgi:hypothetical protein
MLRRLQLLTILSIIFSACLVRAEPVIDPEVFINQTVQVYGLSGMPWEKDTSIDEERSRAWMDSLHHAYDQILDLPLMEGKLVRHVFQTNAALKDRLGMVLLSAPKTFYEVDASGLLRCRLDVPFNGKLSIRSALYLAALRPEPMKPSTFLASWTSGLKIKEDEDAPDLDRIVVDLRNCNFQPSLFPRFFDEKGFLLFQEAMIPSPSRFSRPAVRFVQDIRKAYEGVDEEKLIVVDAKVPELALRDISVAQAEAEIFARFCQEISNNPDSSKEIIVVFKPFEKSLGVLKKKEAKKEDSKSK